MGERGKRVHLFAVEQDVQFDQIGRPETVHVPVERGVALGDALQFVVEVNHYLTERHIEKQLHTVAGNILLLDQFGALAEAQRHNRTDKGTRGNDRRTNIRLLDAVYLCQVGHACRVVHLFHRSVLEIDVVTDVGHGGDDVHVELAVQTLLNDFHVEQSEEPAAESESERD